MKLKSKIILYSSLLTTAVATPIAVLTYNSLKSQKKNDIVFQVKNLNFKINPNAIEKSDNSNSSIDNQGNIIIKKEKKFAIENHFASEYTYSSYYQSYTDINLKEPSLIMENSFWNSIVHKYSKEMHEVFMLANPKKGYSLDDFSKNYFFYFHSYANDYEGKLYLRVYIEEKTEKITSKATTYKEIKERKPNWKFVDFELEGFKKITDQDINELSKQEGQYNNIYVSANHNFTIEKNILDWYLKGDFDLKDGYKSIDDLLSNNKTGNNKKLPTIKQENENEIKNAHSNVWKIFSYSKTIEKKWNNKIWKFIVDESKPIWVTKKDDKHLDIHYFVKTYIPSASLDDKNDLNSAKLVQINKEQVFTFNFNYFDLKNLANTVKVSPIAGSELKNFTVDDLQFNSNPSYDSNFINTNGGYFNNLNLYFSDMKLVNQLPYKVELRFRVINKDDKLFKNTKHIDPKAAVIGQPIIAKNKTEGKIIFVFEIRDKGPSGMVFIGFTEVTGFKK